MELLEVREDRNWGIPVPSVAHGLVIKVGIFKLAGGFLCLHEEFRVAEIRTEEEGVVGPLLCAAAVAPGFRSALRIHAGSSDARE